jgi:hypothetical protein
MQKPGARDSREEASAETTKFSVFQKEKACVVKPRGRMVGNELRDKVDTKLCRLLGAL